jgi:hypothetical protein
MNLQLNASEDWKSCILRFINQSCLEVSHGSQNLKNNNQVFSTIPSEHRSKGLTWKSILLRIFHFGSFSYIHLDCPMQYDICKNTATGTRQSGLIFGATSHVTFCVWSENGHLSFLIPCLPRTRNAFTTLAIQTVVVGR